MGVVAGGNQDPIWLKLLNNRCDDSAKGMAIDVATRSGRKRQVDGKAGSRPASHLVNPSAPRVERKLVQRQVEDIGILFKEVLGAVAVMNVKINDGHSLSAVDQVSSRNGDVVEKAKPHRLPRHRMVTRRTNGQEGEVCVTAAKVGDSLNAGTRSPQCGIPTRFDRVRVGVEVAATRPTIGLDRINIRLGVDTKEGLGIDPVGLYGTQINRGAVQAGHHGLEAFGPLGVLPDGGMHGEGIVADH